MRYDSVDKNNNEIYKYLETIYLNNFIKSLDKKSPNHSKNPGNFNNVPFLEIFNCPNYGQDISIVESLIWGLNYTQN